MTDSKKFNTKTDVSGKSMDVLYQKLGNRWYTFYVIDQEVYMGSIPEDVVEMIEKNEKEDNQHVES